MKAIGTSELDSLVDTLKYIAETVEFKAERVDF